MVIIVLVIVVGGLASVGIVLTCGSECKFNSSPDFQMHGNIWLEGSEMHKKPSMYISNNSMHMIFIIGRWLAD